MSWLSRRWRTQRNAIRHANCKIQRVIKSLNATCAAISSMFRGVFVHPHPPPNPPLSLSLLGERSGVWRGVAPVVFLSVFLSHSGGGKKGGRKTHPDDNIFFLEMHSIKNVALAPCYSFRKGAVTWRNLIFRGTAASFFKTEWSIISLDRTSTEARLPAEFKHITKPRKRK